MPRTRNRKTKRKKAKLSDSTDETKQCNICLDNITTRGQLPTCDHDFCYECIYEWSKNTNTCPLCKERFRCIRKISIRTNTPVRHVRIPDKDQSDHFTDSDYLEFDNDNDSFIDDTNISDTDTTFNDEEEWPTFYQTRYELRSSQTSGSSSTDTAVSVMTPPSPNLFSDDDDIIRPMRLRPLSKRCITSPVSPAVTNEDDMFTSSPICSVRRARPLLLSDNEDMSPVRDDRRWLNSRKRPILRLHITLTRSFK